MRRQPVQCFLTKFRLACLKIEAGLQNQILQLFGATQRPVAEVAAFDVTVQSQLLTMSGQSML